MQAQTIAAMYAQLEQDLASDRGWDVWDGHYATATAAGHTSAWASMIAYDEMTRAGWIRTAAGWTR
jgi:hypothetical protein